MPRRLIVGVGLAGIGLAALGAVLLLQPAAPERPHAVSSESPGDVRSFAGGSVAVEPGGSPPDRRRGSSLPLSPRELDRRILALDRRLAEAPEDVEARASLARALAERAGVAGRPVDLLEALEQVERARTVAPDRSEVLYERARILTDLGLYAAARRGWERCLADRSSSARSEAARWHQALLEEPTLEERWADHGREAILGAARRDNAAAVGELLTAYRIQARPWIEERLLAAWAEAAAGGDVEEAAGRLEVLRVLARTLADATGDRTALLTLAAIDGSPPGSRATLVEGLRLYGRAMELYRAFGPEDEKNDLLERAAAALDEAGAPLWRWARFYRAVGWHRVQPERAERELAALAEGTSPDRQPALLARIEWLLGTNEVTRNRYERSLEHYRRARELLEGSEGPQGAAFLDLLIAEALSKLGELDPAWSARITATQGLSPLGDPQRLHAALYSTVEQLFLEGRPAAAGAYVEELVTNAERWEAPIGLAEAALQEGRLEAGRGRTAEAADAFRRAWEAVARVEDRSLRRRTEATIALYEAESLGGAAPAGTERALERARAEMVDLGYRFQLPRLDAARAALALARGDRDAAGAALRSAVAEEERIRREVRDASMRASAFEGAQRAFDLLIALELDGPPGSGRGGPGGSDARAFAWTERSRARVLLDLLSDDPHARSPFDRPVALDRLVAAMPAGTDLLELAVLPDRLVLWWVRSEGSRRFETRIAAGELEARVERLRRAVEYGGDEETVRRSAVELRRILLGPVEDDLAPGRRLVVVPDRFLGRVPFAALFDPSRGTYLVEERPITVAPSATAYLAAREARTARGDGPPATILAVGANHPERVPLPRVAAEAAAVGELYPRATVLTGEEATRKRFLEAVDWAEVIHFAGHGEDDGSAAIRSRLFFRPATADDPGLLRGEELAARRLGTTRLAVLAACRSVSPGRRGRENVSGLAAALLAAGVPTVVASLWGVDDAVTGKMMTAFHHHLRRGASPSEALRRAQLDLVGSPTPHRSPRHWAGFVAVGAE